MSTLGTPTRVALQNILLATDFSTISDASLPFATGLAHRYGSTLFVVTVVPSVPYDLLPADPLQPAFIATEKMKLLAASEQMRGVPHKDYVEQGDVAAVLAEFVPRHQIDLIVLGTHGRRGVDKLLLGSVAENVFRHATCPVLTIGPHVTHKIKEGELRHILYATNYGQETQHAIPWALSLAEEHHAKVTLLHASDDVTVPVADLQPGAPPAVAIAEMAAYYEQELRRMVPHDASLAQHPDFVVEFGEPAAVVVDMARKLDADIIVMGVKRPMPLATHLGASIAYKVVCDAPCPVLTVGHDLRV